MPGQPMGQGFDDRGPAGEPADDRGGAPDEYARAEEVEDRDQADTDDEGYPVERETAEVEPMGDAPGEITDEEDTSEVSPPEAEEPDDEVSEETATRLPTMVLVYGSAFIISGATVETLLLRIR